MARILIVEDEEKIARFVTLELEHEGYRGVAAGLYAGCLAKILKSHKS